MTLLRGRLQNPPEPSEKIASLQQASSYRAGAIIENQRLDIYMLAVTASGPGLQVSATKPPQNQSRLQIYRKMNKLFNQESLKQLQGQFGKSFASVKAAGSSLAANMPSLSQSAQPQASTGSSDAMQQLQSRQPSISGERDTIYAWPHNFRRLIDDNII